MLDGVGEKQSIIVFSIITIIFVTIMYAAATATTTTDGDDLDETSKPNDTTTAFALPIDVCFICLSSW